MADSGSDGSDSGVGSTSGGVSAGGGGASGITSTQKFRLLVDDYIVPSEPVIDYVTRFSGLHEDDLNPATSRYAVVPYRTAYLKLRYFIDSGCIFVGHGLQNDFETANIFVPPQQVIISFFHSLLLWLYHYLSTLILPLILLYRHLLSLHTILPLIYSTLTLLYFPSLPLFPLSLPPSPFQQIRDTVELWRLPNQRKISLRFLAAYLLKADIQDEIHDSIEDAKTALLLYLHYETVRAKGLDVLHRLVLGCATICY